MSTVMLVVHPDHAEAHQLAGNLASRLTDAGHVVWMIGAAERGLPSIGDDGDLDTTDYVIALGGDGTMLHAIYLLDGRPIPVLGINMGHLGYLTEVEPEHLDRSVDRLLRGPEAGGWTTEERMMLDVIVEDADGVSQPAVRALNEAVIEKRQSGHTINMMVCIDGEAFTSYAADGMIVATPTGSTAYSMSARGPIVSPKHRAMLLTPVAPHMLFDRSLVLDPTEQISIEVVGPREAAVAVDGRFVAHLRTGATVFCTPSQAVARFVRFEGDRYHQRLKTKFGLADR